MLKKEETEKKIMEDYSRLKAQEKKMKETIRAELK